MRQVPLVLLLTLQISFVVLSKASHVITTPRRWISEDKSQVCISVTSEVLDGDRLSFSLMKNKDAIIPTQTIPLASIDDATGRRKVFFRESGSSCIEIDVPVTSHRDATLIVEGLIGGQPVNHEVPINIMSPGKRSKTYIQTDKYIYKPAQIVNIRALTIEGPDLKVANSSYPEIWIENPSGSIIHQWLNVSNDQGLIHLKYTLSDDPLTGTYKVSTYFKDKMESAQFKIEDYVLPRFEVTIKAPKYFPGDTEFVIFDVCASYTFGQPVKGIAFAKASMEERHYGFGGRPLSIQPTLKIQNITGCTTFNFTDIIQLGLRSHFRDKVIINANVIEEGTDIDLEAETAKVEVKRNPLSFKDISVQPYYYPELPHVHELQVSHPDGSGAVGELMSVCAGSNICKNYTTNTKGVLKFAMAPHTQHDKIIIKSLNNTGIKYPDSDYKYIVSPSKHTDWIKSYISPSNSSIVIGLTEGQLLQCSAGEETKFNLPLEYVSVRQPSAEINIQVVSRGQIQFSESIDLALNGETALHIPEEIFLETPRAPETEGAVIGSLSIPVTLPNSVSPKAKILVWYARADGEVVSDQRSVDVTACMMNSVGLSWSSKKVRPGDQASLSLTTEPNSLCSLGVVDKSVELLSAESGNDITMSKILSHTETFDISGNYNTIINDTEFCEYKYQFEDEAGTTTPHPWAPDGRYVYYTQGIDSIKMFNEAGVHVITDLETEFRICHRGPYRHDVVFYGLVNSGGRRGLHETVNEMSEEQRTYFPETWLWKLVLTSDSGTVEERLTLPDTVTEWVGMAVCVNQFVGVGISDPSSIITFRDFFVDLTLPSSAKRGETLPVKISVFNYLEEPLPIKVSLHGSSEYDIIGDGGKPVATGERLSCVQPSDKEVHSIYIRLKATGDLNMTIDAVVDTNAIATCIGGDPFTEVQRRDTIVKPIHTEFEGFPKEETFTEYLCPKGTDIQVEWDLSLPPSVVEDSGRGFVSLVGDLMGPTIDNLGHLVKMPHGCGEQNMLGFAPNIFVMQYLEVSKQLTNEIEGKALKFMNSGYKRELNYRHRDGAYSAFGDSGGDVGSTWLTAFVLKCFAQATPYISILDNDIAVSRNWLKSIQMENGCFESVGKVLHKGMKGGLAEGNSTGLLTSFVLISLLESGENATGDAVTGAAQCINTDKSTSNYALAVKAYALSLAKSPTADAALGDLLQGIFKTVGKGLEVTLKPDSALAVEAAGYAVLALLEASPTKYQNKISTIVKFMNNNRNGQGGFVSTQDTIVALQALAQYEEKLPQIVIDVLAEVTIGGQITTVAVNELNKIVLQTIDMPTVPTKVNVKLSGKGCVLVQTVFRYNVPNPDASEAFSMVVTAVTVPDRGCKTKRIEVCASYELPDLKSNMAIIEIDVMTGYIPDKTDLKNIVGSGSGQFKRYEVDGSKVLLYVDEFSSAPICAGLNVLREFDVEDAKNGTVKVYDYYSPDYSISESYRLPPATECFGLETIPENGPPPIYEDYGMGPPPILLAADNNY